MLFATATLIIGSAHAAVTMAFSTTKNAAEGFANSSGSQSVTMVWGIIVDEDGDGFDTRYGPLPTIPVDGGLLYTNNTLGGRADYPYDPSFELRSTIGTAPGGGLPDGQQLRVDGQLTDDRIFISSYLMPVVSGEARATILASFNYSSAMNAGDQYAIVWFDATSLGGVLPHGFGPGTGWGMWTDPFGDSPSNATILPADPGTYAGDTTGPAGLFRADDSGIGQSLKLAVPNSYPEPSVALLSLISLMAFLRRCRGSAS